MLSTFQQLSIILSLGLLAQSACYGQPSPSLSRGDDLHAQNETTSVTSADTASTQKFAEDFVQPLQIAAANPRHKNTTAKEASHIFPQLPPEEPLPSTTLPLSPLTLEVAKDIGLLPYLERLAVLKQKYLVSTSAPHQDLMATRIEVDEQILNTQLEVASTVAELDTQIAQTDSFADYLENKRDKSLRNNSIFNFSSGGAIQGFASSMQVGTGDNNALQNFGNEMEVIQAAFQLMVSMYALTLTKGKSESSPLRANMLAPILGREPADYNKYPPSVWAYLNDAPAGTDTRREILVKRWVDLGRIQPLSKRGSAAELNALCGTVPLPKSVTIDLLRNRIPMMEDVRAVVSSMSKALYEIMYWVRKR